MPAERILSDEDIRKIWKRNQKGESQNSLAKEFGVSQPAIFKRLKRFKETMPLPVSKKTPTPQEENKISSDQIRTAIFVLTGKSSRDTIAGARDKLIKILKELDDTGTILT